MSTDSPWMPPAAPSRTTAARRPPVPAPEPVGTNRADALGGWALGVSAVAFLLGWLPVVGLVIGVGGMILSVLAKRRSNRRNSGRWCLILSSWAVLTNVGIIVFVLVRLVASALNLPS